MRKKVRESVSNTRKETKEKRNKSKEDRKEE